MNKISRRLFSVSVFLSIALGVQSQVTIGMSKEPQKGAVLQLQNLEDNNGANANKGLGMPRVLLTDIKQLYPMFKPGYSKPLHDLAHTGLLVFNVNENLENGAGVGLYVWDGEQWVSLSGEPEPQGEIKIEPNDTIIISERVTTGLVTVTTTPDDMPWSILTPTGDVNSSTATKQGDHQIQFAYVPNTYGNVEYTVGLGTATNPKVKATINVHHIGLELSSPTLLVDGDLSYSGTGGIQALGGSAEWEVKSSEVGGFEWEQAPENIDGKLVFKIIKPTTSGIKKRQIVISHKDDRQLTRVLTVELNKDIVSVPEHDYFFIDFDYSPESHNRKPEVDNGEFQGGHLAASMLIMSKPYRLGSAEDEGHYIPSSVPMGGGGNFNFRGIPIYTNNPAGNAYMMGYYIYQDDYRIPPKNGSFSGKTKTRYTSVFGHVAKARPNLLAKGETKYKIEIEGAWDYPDTKDKLRQESTDGTAGNKIRYRVRFFKGGVAVALPDGEAREDQQYAFYVEENPDYGKPVEVKTTEWITMEVPTVSDEIGQEYFRELGTYTPKFPPFYIQKTQGLIVFEYDLNTNQGVIKPLVKPDWRTEVIH